MPAILRRSRVGAGFVLLLLLAGSGFGLDVPKPSIGLNFAAGSDFEHNSDTAMARRPATAYWGALDGSISWWLLTAGLTLRYSTEDKFTAQRVNSFGFTPAWSWGRLYVGDFSTTFSEFTLSGVSVYGGGLELFPGPFRFGVVAGKTRRASKDSLDWAYDRNLYGLRIGAEQFSLTVLKVADDTLSNPAGDSAPVAAQENLVVGLNSNINLAHNLRLTLDAGASAFSANIQSESIDIEQIPRFAYKLFTPRLSSSADYALRAGLTYAPSFASLGLEFVQVGPGYTSLGLAGIENDYRHLRLTAATQVIPNTQLNTYAELGADNLARTNTATATTGEFGVSVSYVPTSRFSVSANYSLNRLTKDAEDDSFDVRSLTQFVSVGPSLVLDNWGMNQTVSAVVSYQAYNNSAPYNQTEPSRPVTLALSYSITPKIPVTLSTSFSHTWDLAQTGQELSESYQSYGLSAGKSFFHDRLQNNVSVAYQPSTSGRAFPITGSHSFGLTDRDAVSLVWGFTLFSSQVEGVPGFSYQRVSLNYNRRVF